MPGVDLRRYINDPLLVQGLLDSRPSTHYRIEFFANAFCDPSGFGEGQFFIGSTNVTTGANCSNQFAAWLPVSLPTGVVVTATATDSDGNTSEFSACRKVTLPLTHDLAITSLKAPAAITLSAAKPSITKPVIIQIQNLGTNSETITAAALSNGFVRLHDFESSNELYGAASGPDFRTAERAPQDAEAQEQTEPILQRQFHDELHSRSGERIGPCRLQLCRHGECGRSRRLWRHEPAEQRLPTSSEPLIA